MKYKHLLPLCAAPLLASCAIAVDYGRIPHSIMAAGDRCNPTVTDTAAMADKPYFAVTSRLPDCTGAAPALTVQRGDHMRYLQFGGFDKAAKAVPFTFAPEGDWWGALQKATLSGKGQIIVYVHGYRETFHSSSKDAIQIKRMTGFDGPIIQYSWPSQGKLLSYLVDENNMEIDQRNFAAFLQKLSDMPWAKDIILVTHSLGVRLALPALRNADAHLAAGAPSPISNIILVSPDIDREAFEQDATEEFLSPARIADGRHITVYASRKDQAIAISRNLHGYPRLGSPYCFDTEQAAALQKAGQPIRCYAKAFPAPQPSDTQSLLIIDTTALPHRRTAHSDYISSSQACLDFVSSVSGLRGRSDLRHATALPHVFTLLPPGARAKDDNACRSDD